MVHHERAVRALERLGTLCYHVAKPMKECGCQETVFTNSLVGTKTGGRPPDAGIDTITNRYNALRQQLLIAKGSRNPLEEELDFRLEQLRAAYDSILYETPLPECFQSFPKPIDSKATDNPTEMSISPLHQADELLQNKQFLMARSTLDECKDVESAEWNFLYGKALYALGFQQDALEHLLQASRLEPNNSVYCNYYNKTRTDISNAIQKEQEIQQEQERRQRNAAVGCCCGSACTSCLCDSCCDN